MQTVQDIATTTIAIVGAGPRGLSALEQLCTQWDNSGTAGKLRIEIFEPSEHPGAGLVYALEQNINNWLNVPERLIDLPRRDLCKVNQQQIDAFPSYWEFSNLKPDQLSPHQADKYPTRAELGQYLHARFQSIAKPLIEQSTLTWHQKSVTSIHHDKIRWHVCTRDGDAVVVDELVIAAGHQPTELDEQLAAWVEYVKNQSQIRCFTTPFPVEQVKDYVSACANAKVALRGFGLSTIDVMKALTEGLGGSYVADDTRATALRYQASGNEAHSIIPFSLDGLPPCPKPLSLFHDQIYTLSNTQLERLSQSLYQAFSGAASGDLKHQLIEQMAILSTEVFSGLGSLAQEHDLSRNELTDLVSEYLTETTAPTHALFDCDLPITEALVGYIEMASGNAPISLDYCLGQVWRHAQPTLYKALSYRLRHIPEQAEIIALDERMKRYAFGPPVASIERVIALQNADILKLDIINNPELQLTKDGWLLETEAATNQARIMVNTVLDSTRVNKVESALFASLLEQDIVEPTHPGLGVAITSESLAVKTNDSSDTPPMAVLGRLAQGSLVGVDAILECFGDRQKHWAECFVSRHPHS